MKLGSVGSGFLGVAAVFFCYLMFCQFYLIAHARGGIFQPFSSLVLIPAARLDGHSVSYRYVVEMARAMKVFAEEDKKLAFKRALSVSVHRLYLESLADQLEISVSKAEVEDYPVDFATISPQLEEAKWSERQYKKYMVEPLLLSQKVSDALAISDAHQSEALGAMDALRNKLGQGMPFADAAEQFSEDPSAWSRGDLGLMSVAEMPTWLIPALDLEPGDISEVLNAPNAYWTVTMIEYYPSEVPEQAAVRFRGIAVKKKSFAEILADEKSQTPAWVFTW